jgi:hypothetical protein
MTVEASQRHTKRNRCPICDGADGDPRGQEKRCSGFTSSDGEYAHCSREELAGGLDQENGGTFAHRLHGPCKCGQTHGPDRRPVSREVVATYVYENAERAPLFRVVRTAGKDFYQQHRDSAGEWQNGRNGVAPTLYRLPQLTESDGPVYVVEGEKDVETLEKRGFLATTNPGGAGKWHHVVDVAKTVLQGRDIIIIADNDEPGRKHAREVAASLCGVARSVRAVRCPTAKDITDHLATGGTMTLEQFVELDAAEQPTAGNPLAGLDHLAKVAVVGRAKLVELAERPIVWLWEQIATAGLTVLLAAGTGSGKTTLLFLLIAARANRGKPVQVLGYTMTPAPPRRFIVVIENEHSDESAARILRRSCARLGIDESALDCIILVARHSVRIGSPEWQDIEVLIAAGLVSDVVLDTLASSAPTASPDSNDETEQVATFDVIRKAIDRAPSPEAWPTFWLAVHTRKCDGVPTLNDVAGSMQRAGQADVVLLMGAEREGDKVRAVKVAFGKVREKDADDWPAPVEYIVKRDRIVLLDAPAAADDRPLDERILARLQRGPHTKNALSTALGRNKDDLEEPLTALFAAKRIRTTSIEVRGISRKGFALADAPDSQGPIGHRTLTGPADRAAMPDSTPDDPRTLFGGEA